LSPALATLLAKADWAAQELATADALANTLEKSRFPIAAGKLRAGDLDSRAAGWFGPARRIMKILTTPPGQLPPALPTIPGSPPIVTVPPRRRPEGPTGGAAREDV
jgi:hypothetical protein